MRGPRVAFLLLAGAFQAAAQVAPAWNDGLKSIHLAEGSNLSLGGEVRARVESIANDGWNASVDTDTTLLLRAMLSADLRLGRRFRFFVDLKSAVENGRDDGPRLTDEDRLDVHQAFADVGLGDGSALTLRVGRQELVFGSSRLVSNRKGPNVPRSFDGVSVKVSAGAWRIDVFAVNPAKTRRGVFDDSPDRTIGFWGAYAVRPLSLIPRANVDVYYLGLDRDASRFDQGAAVELRESVGTRVWSKGLPLDYDFEIVHQWGRFGSAPIRAWTVASDTGYTFGGVFLEPRIGLKADITSGDSDPKDARLQTFNPLFPRGSYFGEAALIGPQNHIDLHPSVHLEPFANVAVNISCDFFWRESTKDGVYDPSGRLLRSGRGTAARFVGSQPTLTVTARLGKGVTFVAGVERFIAGRFLKESGAGDDLTYFTSWITLSF